MSDLRGDAGAVVPIPERLELLEQRVALLQSMLEALLAARRIKVLAAGVTATPGVSSGQPCVIGTGIQTEVIAGRHAGGDSIEALAKDYRLTAEQVRQAIAYERETR